MAERVASTRNCLMHIRRMAEGWGEDEIKAGIAHLRSLHAVRKRRANKDEVNTRASAVSHLAGTCPEKSRKPAASVACTFRHDPPGFARHLREHRSKECSKCTYARNRTSWKLATRILGLPHSWLQVRPVASKYWAVGCRVCRWYSHRSAILGTNGHCKTNPFVHMEVTGCSLQTSTFRRHAVSKQHRLAAEALRKGDGTSSLGAPPARTFLELLERLRTGGLEQTRRGDRKQKQTPVWLGVCTKPCGMTSATF